MHKSEKKARERQDRARHKRHTVKVKRHQDRRAGLRARMKKQGWQGKIKTYGFQKGRKGYPRFIQGRRNIRLY